MQFQWENESTVQQIFFFFFKIFFTWFLKTSRTSLIFQLIYFEVPLLTYNAVRHFVIRTMR